MEETTTIIRVPRRYQFVSIEQALVEDKRLTWAARGIQCYLLSRPDDWEVRVTDLCRKGDLSRGSIYKLLKELRKYGYICYHRKRNEQGQYRGGIYYVHESPGISKSPHAEIPDMATPDAVSPDTVKPDALLNMEDNLITTTTYKEENNSITTTTRQSGCSSNLDLVYPKDLLKEEQIQAGKLLQELSSILAQQILDEWAGIIAANAIHTSKLGCLRGLINRAKEGTFTPEKGVSVTAIRKRQHQVEQSQKDIKHEELRKPLPTPDPDNPLTQRIAAIAARQQNRKTQ